MAPWSLLSLVAAGILVTLKPEYSLWQSYTWTAAAFLSIILVCRFVYSAILYPNYLTPLKYLPTPPDRNWITGNTDSIYLEPPRECARKWTETVPNDGLIRYYAVGNLERVLVTTPKAMAEVFSHKPYETQKTDIIRISLSRIVGNGLLMAEKDEHKAQRRNLMPAFSYRHVKDLYHIFWSKGAEMVKAIETHLQKDQAQDNVVKIGNWAGRATLDIIGVAGMDQDFKSLQDPNNKLSSNYRKLLDEPSAFFKLLSLVGIFLVGLETIQNLPLTRNKEVNEAADYVRTIARQMIRQKKDKIEQKQNDSVDIISVALESGGFSEENLVDQMMTFLAAGHETTATALQWAIYVLCKHPDIQSRLRDEVRASLPSISDESQPPISASAVDGLPFLSAFCNEVLRFYPPVPLTVRQVANDITIIDSPIPKGTIMLMFTDTMNRSKEYWGPDADEFKPERWLGPGRAKNGGASNNYAFLTFIHGPRSCIGQSFAKGELACLVAVMVGRFQMELKDPNAELEVMRGITQRPKDGVQAKLTVLQGW
ncbi:hypothetical protein Egran_06623 [Elaphomyces granulatus]|uniref:Cytochrome P450 monooxygenase n=1 Tax=Elaphomyces granulatus TaxID=519963 RepID=A0A232LN89_9EURO|nr:hypothetical protein Egran_06623 [Elaphomyces granulatus]